jgi:hypothetical protein
MSISIHAGGRLGNFLYQAACALAMAKRYNTDAIFQEAEQLKYFPKLKKMPPEYRVSTFYQEQGAGFQDIPYTPDMCLVGYWQSYKYFVWCRHYVLEQFDFKWRKWEGTCSIHIRRGDYLEYKDKHNSPTKEYFEPAMKMISEKGINFFIVFGDDKQWNKENLNSGIYPDYKFQHSEHIDPYEDMRMMSCCEYNIICSSTFSIWAAELNRNPDKIVITPHEDDYYGPSHKEQDVKDLLRPEWIRIKY